MKSLSYRVCSNCIMDTSDSRITFDERGWYDYCRNFYENILPNWHPNEKSEKVLAPVIEKIKNDGTGRDRDCLIGISGRGITNKNYIQENYTWDGAVQKYLNLFRKIHAANP